MKRWITLILAAVTLMCGCGFTALAEGTADSIPDAATEIAQIDKYGNIDLSVSPEAFMGADAGEIAADYMRTFSVFYGLQEGTDQYQKISDSFLVSSPAVELGLSSAHNADLKSAAEAYLKKIGMTDDEIASLKGRLARDYSEET